MEIPALSFLSIKKRMGNARPLFENYSPTHTSKAPSFLCGHFRPPKIPTFPSKCDGALGQETVPNPRRKWVRFGLSGPTLAAIAELSTL